METTDRTDVDWESMRHPMVVGKRIKDLLPETINTELLDGIIKASYYKSSEQWPSCFDAIAVFVNDVVGQPPISEDWQFNVVAEFVGISVDEAKERFSH